MFIILYLRGGNLKRHADSQWFWHNKSRAKYKKNKNFIEMQ
jgi:hypothetical protein